MLSAVLLNMQSKQFLNPRPCTLFHAFFEMKYYSFTKSCIFGIQQFSLNLANLKTYIYAEPCRNQLFIKE